MEFFQTIWTALITPNQFLINILTFIFCFVESFVYMLLFSTILKLNLTKKNVILYVLSLSLTSTILSIFLPSSTCLILSIFIVPFLIKFIFKTTFIKGIIAEVISFSLSLLLELIFSQIILNCFKTDFVDIMNIPIFRLSICSIIYTLVFCLYLIAKKFSFSIKILEDLSKPIKRTLLITLLLTLFIVVFQFFILAFYSDSFSIIISILNICCIVAYFIISITCFFNIINLSVTTKNLEQEQLSNKTLQLLYDNGRGFRHDFGNILQAIGGYVTSNDMPGLEKYYRQLSSDFYCSNNLSCLKPTIINNHAIYVILASKYHKCDELGIKVSLEVGGDFSDMHMKIYEFTRILGILLDNAIEAASACSNDKIVNVKFSIDLIRRMQTLYIENSYTNKDVNIDNIFEKGFSTKEGNTGLGLYEVKRILKRNNNLNLYTNKTPNLFIQQLEIFF